VIRTIQSIARTRRLTVWSKAFAAVAKSKYWRPLIRR
jgi:hypothetical protein